MKQSKILKVLVSFLLITLLAVNIYAADNNIPDNNTPDNNTPDNNTPENNMPEDTIKNEWTDFSKAKIVLTQKADISFWKYTIKVTGVTLNEDSIYAVYMTNGENKPSIPTKWDDIMFDNNVLKYLEKGEKEEEVDSDKIESYLEKSGDIYCWIIEGRRNENGEFKLGNLYGTRLDRPNLHSLGNRIKCFFSNNETSTFFYEAGSVWNKERKVKLKIGTISDNNILLSIKNGEANCLQKLMDYAKSAPSIYTGTVPLGDSDSITGNMNLVDQAYYYVYMQMDDENGKYYPVEDISLYQALVDETTIVGKNLYDYLDDNFKWNLAEGDSNKTDIDGKKDPTIANMKLPNTGVTVIFGVVISILIASAGFGIYQYNKYKGIK